MDSEVAILLVDDREENLFAMEAVLESADYRVVRATSGEEALLRVLERDFAVILLDVQMPGMDGFETAVMIRERAKSRHIPIIFITAISKDEGYVFKGYSLGAVDYIFKPVETEILRSKVAVFVELFRKNQQVRAQAELLRRHEQRERERALEALRQQSEQRYRSLADAVPQLIWRTDPQGAARYVNRRWEEYTGLRPEQAGDGLGPMLDPRDRSAALARWRAACKAGRARSFEVRLRRAGGEARWHLIQAAPERDGDGKLVGWLGTATDIDDLHLLAQSLFNEKERLAITLRSIADAVITTDAAGRIELMNGTAETMTGWRNEEAAGLRLPEVFAPCDSASRMPLPDVAAAVMRKGVAHGSDAPALLACRREGERLIAYTCAPIMDARKTPVGAVLVFSDIGDKLKLEDERLKASKLESIGVLAGALAHDFNNILTAILGNIALAKLYAGADSVGERLGEAEKAAMWAKDLTQQLLTFSKGGAPVKKVLALGEVLRDAAAFANTGSSCVCTVEVPKDLWPVEADEGQLRQVIHNLVLNAQQAMSAGGEIRISAENRRVGPRSRLLLKPGKYVCFTCEDRGVGIAPEHLPKIFDPYFTTKQVGSGLGLATAYSIVKRHTGLITVESQLGAGATFAVYLPATASVPAEPVATLGAATGPATGRILVMDDEAGVRDILARLFGHFGYDVVVTSDGKEALAAYREAREAGRCFDVVIMDLVVPAGMGGREATERLLALDAGARVVVSSGYSNDPVMADFHRYGFCEAIAKPYQHAELLHTVERIIGQHKGSSTLQEQVLRGP